MLIFFRKIKQQILIENKFSKYLLYAIGEIFLVVIGIILALQVNNWNEDRKKRIALDNTLKTVLNDFENDLPIVKQKIQQVVAKMARTDSVVLGKIPPERLKDCYYCISSNIWFETLNLPNKGLKMLVDFEIDKIATNDTLISELLSFFKRFEETNTTYINLRLQETSINTRWILENINLTVEEYLMIANFQTNESINNKILSNPKSRKRLVHFQAYERANLEMVLSYYEDEVTKFKKKLEQRFQE